MEDKMNMKSNNVVWTDGLVKRNDREVKNGHRGTILWLTGLPASGKTTIAVHLEALLFAHGKHCYRLDGDNIRHGLNANLGFSPGDRDENIRRIGEVAKLFADAGFIVITSFISPYRETRNRVRASVRDPKDFIEVFVHCPLEECEKRDPKGMYKKAREGKIPQFTGISAPYEEPEDPEIVLDTKNESVVKCANRIYDFLERNNYLRP
jgi:adenylylsulfate kinase